MTHRSSEVLLELVGRTTVIPVIVIDRLETAVPLGRALVAGGLTVLEVTLRTEAALDAVRALVREVPEAVVGVGSVIEPAQFEAAARAGARFAVSPGVTPVLLEAGRASSLPWLPAAQTVSEALRLRTDGYRFLKLFPAAPAGGTALLKAIAGPVPDLKFCPTGGIDARTAPEYLALPNVHCVGGSWMCPPAALASGDYAEVTRLARAAAALGRPAPRPPGA